MDFGDKCRGANNIECGYTKDAVREYEDASQPQTIIFAPTALDRKPHAS